MKAEPFLSETERRFAASVGDVLYANPFLPERIAGEREALGSAFNEDAEPWNLNFARRDDPNIGALRTKVGDTLQALRQRPGKVGHRERQGVEYLIVFHLYHEFGPDMNRLVSEALSGADTGVATARLFRRFRAAMEALRELGGGALEDEEDPGHWFASFFQIRRAFHQIASSLTGRSQPIARLRASIWESIFTHDLRRYRRTLFSRMGDMATLVTGPTGTGKELVARAIGLSRYVPFDATTCRFVEDFAEGFYPLNLSALSPTLIESELFGHRKGAFTGAWTDREGWLESCPVHGTVFLDEVGDLDAAIQVKLLRVLQTRTFQRIGEGVPRFFHGKLVAATNRDLGREVAAGRFREDFYYRLCSDRIVTPTLAEQLREDPSELDHLLAFLARRVAGESEGETVADEAGRWIRTHLSAEYAWPGNFRELEQCVRSIVIRGAYQPLQTPVASTRVDPARRFLEGDYSLEELQQTYCRQVYKAAGSYEEAARRLGVDRRTVRRYATSEPCPARRKEDPEGAGSEASRGA